MVGLEKKRRILQAVGQGKTLLPQFQRCLVLCPYDIEDPQSPQDGEELRRLTYLLTQRSRPSIGSPCFWGSPTFGRAQSRTKRDLQVELLLGALGGVRACPEHLQPLAEVRNGLQVRRALNGALARPLPVR